MKTTLEMRNEKGEILFKIKEIKQISDRVSNQVCNDKLNEFYKIITLDNKKGMIDSKANIIVSPKYDEIYWFYSDNSVAIIRLGNKEGLINIKTEEEIVSTKYDMIYGFDPDDLAAIMILGDKEGLINIQTGEEIIAPKYDEIYGFNPDDTVVSMRLDGKEGLINIETGEEIIAPKYDEIDDFDSDDLVTIVRLDGKEGLINVETGEEIVSPKYDKIFVAVSLYEKYDKNFVNFVSDSSYIMVAVNNKYGFINVRTGEEVVSPHYSMRIAKWLLTVKRLFLQS